MALVDLARLEDERAKAYAAYGESAAALQTAMVNRDALMIECERRERHLKAWEATIMLDPKHEAFSGIEKMTETLREAAIRAWKADEPDYQKHLSLLEKARLERNQLEAAIVGHQAAISAGKRNLDWFNGLLFAYGKD